MKIILRENEFNPEIEFESEIVFNNGDFVFIENKLVVLYDRVYHIDEDLSEISGVWYSYKEK